MVEQLGLAMILSSFVSVAPFTSGTINFLSACMRQADELSITVQPAWAKRGAKDNEVPPPALNKAICGFSAIASATDTIVCSFPLKDIFCPTDLSEATGMSSVTGKFRSSNIFNIVLPTSPVAPTKAMRIIFIFSANVNFWGELFEGVGSIGRIDRFNG